MNGELCEVYKKLRDMCGTQRGNKRFNRSFSKAVVQFQIHEGIILCPEALRFNGNAAKVTYKAVQATKRMECQMASLPTY